MSAVPSWSHLFTGGALIGAATVAYGVWEAHQFQVRTAALPVLPPGSSPIRLLHISDLHFGQHPWGKTAFVQSLTSLDPDLLLVTGDNLNHEAGIDHVLTALAPFAGLPGGYILGSHDYYAPQFENPVKYLLGQGKTAAHQYHSRRFPTHKLEAGFQQYGWKPLTNRTDTLTVADVTVGLVGVDDPHIGRDDYVAATTRELPDADVLVGLTHAPYRRVLDAMAADGAALILAGHTHGGQICLPGGVPLITNADSPREHAHGLTTWTAPDGAQSWLHVSAGLGGASKLPIRLFCPPEVMLLTLAPHC